MASKKLGDLIREARTNAGFTQEKLASRISGLSASDISKAERGEKDLTQDQLKQIAKLTGVTQASLLNAAKGKSGSTKSGTTKSGTKSASKSTCTSKSSSSSTSAMKVSASEKKLVEAFRDATSDQKKAALYILKGESNDLVDDILRKHSNDGNGIGSFLEDVLGGLLGK